MSLKLLQRYPDRAFLQEVAGPYRLATVTGINAKSTGPTTLLSVPASVDIVVLKVVLRCTAASGITDPAEGGVGVAAGYDDIYESQPFYGLESADVAYVFPNSGVGVVVSGGSDVVFEIDTAAQGTSQTLAADLIGYQVN